MSLEPLPSQAAENISERTAPFPTELLLKAIYGVFLIITPGVSFLSIAFLAPDWQSNELVDYVNLFLLPKSAIWFFPLIEYSVLCYLLLLFSPLRFAQIFLIRLGIYTGVILALQYSFILIIQSPDFSIVILIILGFLPLFLQKIIQWGKEIWKKDIFRPVITVLFVIVALLLAFGFILGISLIFGLFLILPLFLSVAPFWIFLLYFKVAIWLFKNYETKLTLARGFGITAWLSVYIAAWRYGIIKTYELYAALPPQPPPDCYIATAAARGHPQFVHSKTIQRAGGESMQVNEQLQVLKCMELALMAVNPRMHMGLRKVYNKLGKPLARKIQNPFMADIAYLLLSPFEWLARFILKMIIPDIESISQKIYIK